MYNIFIELLPTKVISVKSQITKLTLIKQFKLNGKPVEISHRFCMEKCCNFIYISIDGSASVVRKLISKFRSFIVIEKENLNENVH